MTTTKNLVVVRTPSSSHIGYLNSTDGTEAEVKIVNTPGDTGESLGDALNGRSITEIEVFCATPSDLDSIKIYDENAGLQWEGEGNITAAMFPAPNFIAQGLSIPTRKGFTLKINTSD